MTFELLLYGFHVDQSPCCHPRLTCHQRFTTNRSSQSTWTWWLYTVSETVNCYSYDCPSGYALIRSAGDVKCDKGKCQKSVCCDRVCSSYRCPRNYTSKRGSEHIKCDFSECTTDKCCDYLCEPSLSPDCTSGHLKHRCQYHRVLNKTACRLILRILVLPRKIRNRHRSFAIFCLQNSAFSTVSRQPQRTGCIMTELSG